MGLVFLSSNQNRLTMNFFERHLDKFNNMWNWMLGFSHHHNLTTEFLEKHMDKSWDWISVSKNPMKESFL